MTTRLREAFAAAPYVRSSRDLAHVLIGAAAELNLGEVDLCTGELWPPTSPEGHECGACPNRRGETSGETDFARACLRAKSRPWSLPVRGPGSRTVGIVLGGPDSRSPSPEDERSLDALCCAAVAFLDGPSLPTAPPEQTAATLRVLTEISPAAIYITDKDGRCLFANERWLRMAGLTIDQALGEGWIEGLHPDDRESVFANWEQTIAGQGAWGTEYRFIDAEGTIRWVYGVAAPIVTDGVEVGYVGVNVDVTERRRLDEQQRRLDEQLSKLQRLESLQVLAAGLAGELDHLLSGLQRNTDQALSHLPERAPAAPYLRAAKLIAHIAAELAEQMHAYSGRTKLEPEVIDASELVEGMTQRLLANMVRLAKLHVELPKGLPHIEGDPKQLEKIIMQLVSNALDALGQRGGLVTITTGSMVCDADYLADDYLLDDLPPGQYVFLDVTDTGVGMDEATLERVFEPFFSTKFAGRGLGMAAVLGTIYGHGGGIQISSTPGEGTRVRLLFPALEFPPPKRGGLGF